MYRPSQSDDSITHDATNPLSIEIPAGVFGQEVTAIHHYTDRLFSFRIKRPPSFRFRSGEFVMIALPSAERPVYRAYSIASPSWDDEIEFFSIKVPNGPLTEHLQKIQPGDTIWMRQKSTGTLVLDCLVPGKRLFMLSTGTGMAPFASLIRDPETYEKFDQVVLTHTCRLRDELAYGTEVVESAKNDPLIGEEAKSRLVHFTSTTQETSPVMGRITKLIDDGTLYSELKIDALDPELDRVMLCGSVAMINDLKVMLQDRGFGEGSNNKPLTFVVERAFVG